MKFNEWRELMNLWESGNSMKRYIVIKILDKMFPDAIGYHAFGRDYFFDSTSEIWAPYFLLSLASEGSVDIPEKYMVKITNLTANGDTFEDTMMEIPGLMRRRLPDNFYVIRREND